MKDNLHVVPDPNGKWQVKEEGNPNPVVKTGTQKEAIDIARAITQTTGGELTIHGRNGRIREKDSHGRDNFPPQG